MSRSLKNQRRKMWLSNPNCRKCGRLTVLPEDIEGYIQEDNLKKKVNTPDNMATIQHVYCRNHPLRTKITKNKRHKLWCFKCNTKESRKEAKKFPGKPKIIKDEKQ